MRHIIAKILAIEMTRILTTLTNINFTNLLNISIFLNDLECSMSNFCYIL